MNAALLEAVQTAKRMLYVHNIDVVGYDVKSNRLVVNTLFSDGSEVTEYVEPTSKAVRDYLGY